MEKKWPVSQSQFTRLLSIMFRFLPYVKSSNLWWIDPLPKILVKPYDIKHNIQIPIWRWDGYFLFCTSNENLTNACKSCFSSNKKVTFGIVLTFLTFWEIPVKKYIDLSAIAVDYSAALRIFPCNSAQPPIKTKAPIRNM